MTAEIASTVLGGVSGLVGGTIAGWLFRTRKADSDWRIPVRQAPTNERVANHARPEDPVDATAWVESGDMSEETEIIARRLRLFAALQSRKGGRARW